MPIRYLSGLSVDSTVLVVDTVNDRVGIGTASPAYKLDVAGTISNNSAQNIIYASYDAVAALFQRVGTYGGVIQLGRSGVSNSTTIDYPADGTFAVSTASSERLRITSSGNVGIGTTSPAYKLDVFGTDDITPEIRIGNSSGKTAFIGFSNTYDFDINAGGVGGNYLNLKGGANGSTGGITFSTFALERMRIDYTGKVGIGTTAPSYKFNVITDAVAGRQNLAAIDRTAQNFITFTNPQYSVDASMGLMLRVFPQSDSRQGAGIIASGGSLNGETDLSLFVSSGTGSSVSYGALNIKGDTGNVGIGTTGPTAKLEVAADVAKGILINRTFTTSSQTLANVRAYYGLAITPLRGGTGGLYFTNYDADTPIIQSVNSSDVAQSLLLNPLGGNVGIGTTSPSYKLQVNAAADGLYVIGANSAPYTQTIAKFVYGGNSNSINIENQGGKASFQARDSSDAAMNLHLNPIGGNVGIGTTGPVAALHVQSASTKLFLSNTDFVSGTTGSGLILTTGASSGQTYSQIYAFQTGNTAYANLVVPGGNVGIGTTSPGATFSEGLQITKTDVSRINVTHTNTTGARQSDILFTENDTITFQVGTVLSNGTFPDQNWLRGTTDLPVTIHTNSIERFRVTPGGGVGIGTANPSQTLTVIGTAGAYSAIGDADNVRTGLAHYDTTAQATGVGGQLVLGYKYTDAGDYTEGAIIKMYKENGTSGNFGSGLKFQVRNNGANLSTKAYIDPSGNFTSIGYGFFNGEGLGTSLRVGGIYSNLGLYVPSSYDMQFDLGWDGIFKFTRGNAERMRIVGSTGNVGIGTTSPTYKLSVEESTTNPIAYFGLLPTNASSRNSLIILQSGTIPQSGSDTTGEVGFLFKHSYGTGGVNGTANGGYIESIRESVFGITSQVNTALIFGTSAANTDNERMRLNGAGQLLINATSSAYGPPLNYGYNLGVKGIAGQAFISIARSTQTLDSEGLAIGLDTSEGAIYLRDNLPLSIYTNNTFAMRIAAGGNVGIGTTSPSQKLDVSGNIMVLGLKNTDNYFEKILGDVSFTNGDANKAFNIILGNSSVWGYIEVEVNSTFNNQSSAGKLTKRFAIGANPGNTIYINESRVSDAMGTIVDNIAIGEFAWDGAISSYVIPISHIVSTGNAYNVRVRCYSQGGSASTVFAALSLSAVYTLTALARQYPYYNDRLGIGTTAPGEKLVVRGDGAKIKIETASNPSTYFTSIESNHDSANTFNINDGGSFRFGAKALVAYNDTYINGYYNVYIATGTATNSNAANIRLFVAQGGNVGIGTTAPSSLLSLSKSGLVDFQLNASDQATDEKNWVWQAGAPVGAGVYRLRAVNDAYTNGVNAVTFTRSGISSVTATFSSSVEATSFIKTSGTSSQFLKADGSVDSSTYLTANQTITLSGVVTGSGTTAITTAIANGAITNAMLANSSFFVGTTSIALGRASAAQTLTGVSIDGNAATATNVAYSGLTGAVPTWNQNTTGSAATLTTARTLTIGSTGKTFDGSANVSWSLAEIGAQAVLTNPVTGTGTTNYIPKFTGASAIGNSLIFDDGTNVGIGTATPGAKLHVAGDGRFEGSLDLGHGSASEYSLEIGASRTGDGFAYVDLIGDTTYPDYGLRMIRNNGGANTSSAITHRGTGNLLIETNEAAPIVFNTSAAERMRILSGGNVGINTTGPDEKLHVNGSTLITYNNSFQSTNSVGNKAILARVSPTSGIVNYAEYATATNLNGFVIGSDDARVKGNIATDSLEFITNTSTRMTVLSGGNVGINTTTPGSTLHVIGDVLIQTGALGVGVNPNATDGRIDASNDIVAFSTSDKRLKENITPIANALEKVRSLTGVEFDWKEETKSVHGYEGHDVGVIAQDVQAVLPEAVRTNDSGYLSVRYEKMIALLVEANKELADRVEQLEKLIK